MYNVCIEVISAGGGGSIEIVGWLNCWFIRIKVPHAKLHTQYDSKNEFWGSKP